MCSYSEIIFQWGGWPPHSMCCITTLIGQIQLKCSSCGYVEWNILICAVEQANILICAVEQALLHSVLKKVSAEGIASKTVCRLSTPSPCVVTSRKNAGLKSNSPTFLTGSVLFGKLVENKWFQWAKICTSWNEVHETVHLTKEMDMALSSCAPSRALSFQEIMNQLALQSVLLKVQSNLDITESYSQAKISLNRKFY